MSQSQSGVSVFEWIWEKITRCLNPRWEWLNPIWQNSRWLPSSSWVRMNEWSFFLQNSWIQDGRIEDGYHHQVESEWMSEVFCANGENQSWQLWVSFRGKTRMSESKMAKFKMVEFKMAAIIKLSQNEWVKFFFCLKWLNQRWQNSRWLTSSSWVRINEFESDWISLSQSFVQNGWIQITILDNGCHHQINQIDLVWVRVRVEWECFWVNLREDNKVFASKIAVSEIQDGRFQDGCHHQVESEWMTEVFFFKMAESKMVKMAAIIKLSQNEWVKFFLCKWWEPILASVSEFKR